MKLMYSLTKPIIYMIQNPLYYYFAILFFKRKSIDAFNFRSLKNDDIFHTLEVNQNEPGIPNGRKDHPIHPCNPSMR